MKKFIFYFFAITFLLPGSTVTVKAQEKTNFIIVETKDGETAEIKLSAVSRQYIEEGDWIFELKESNQKLSYPLAELLPFKVELRNSVGIESVDIEKDWSVCDDGNNLIISVTDGMVGNYSVYDVYGRLLKKEHESGSKASVAVSSGGLYIVKLDKSVKKVMKR